MDLFSSSTSRFAILADDASDPFVKKGKSKTVTQASSGKSKPVTGKGKSGGLAGGNLLSNGHQNKSKKKPPQQVGSKQRVDSSSSEIFEQPHKPKTKMTKKNGSSLDWVDWEKRDTEFVNATFETELEEAILQSKLAFQREQETDNVPVKEGKTSKPKKKKNPIPLSEFQGFVPVSSSSATAALSELRHTEDDETLIERIRAETKLDLLQQRKHAQERLELLARNAHFVNGNPNPVQNSDEPSLNDIGKGSERDSAVSQLEIENRELREELELFKKRFKKLLELLSDTQLKEKVHLIREIERLTESQQELTRLNQDLNEQLNDVCSQLEQERSKSHAAVMEVKKINEQQRRARNQVPSELP